MQLPFLNTTPSTNAMSLPVHSLLGLVALELLLARVIDLLRMNKRLLFVLRRKKVLAVLFGNLLLFNLRNVFLRELNFFDLLQF